MKDRTAKVRKSRLVFSLVGLALLGDPADDGGLKLESSLLFLVEELPEGGGEIDVGRIVFDMD